MRWLVVAVMMAGCLGGEPVAQELDPGPGAQSAVAVYAAQPLDGGSSDLASHQGDVILLTVWASWCGICKQNEPNWHAMQEEYGSQGFTLFAVSREASQQAAQSYVDSNQFAYRQLWDPQVNAAFEMRDYQPNHVLIDRDGNVVTQFEGSMHARAGGEAALRGEIEALLA